MHVLFASFYGDPRLPNAPGQLAAALGRSLAAQGHRRTLWTCATADEGSRPAEFEVLPCGAEDGSRRWLEEWRPDPRVRAFARRELQRLRPDVVLVGAWKYLGEVVLAAREAQIPCALLLHDYSLLCLQSWLLDSRGELCTGPETLDKCITCMEHALGPKGRLLRRLSALPGIGDALARARHKPLAGGLSPQASIRAARHHMQQVLEAATLLVAQTPRVEDILSRNGVSPEKIHLVPQAIPQQKIPAGPTGPPARLEGTASEERALRIAFLGRWSKEKGIQVLLEAFLQSRCQRTCELWLIVSNPVSVRLPNLPRGESKRLRVFTGFTGSATSELLSQVDLCVVPSRCEELASRAALEAMAAGVPVVASSTVGNAYLIEDRLNGRIFPSGSVEALREILEQAAAEPEEITRWRERLPDLPDPEGWGYAMERALVRAIELAGGSEPWPTGEAPP